MAWNKGRLVGAKRPFSEAHIQALRLALTTKGMVRDLAMFETALTTMLRSGDLLKLKVGDVRNSSGAFRPEMLVKMEKTSKPVTVDISGEARVALQAHIEASGIDDPHYLFTALGRARGEHLTPRAYRNIVKDWCRLIHLDPEQYSTHSLRRSQPSIIYNNTGNLRAVQVLLGHRNIGHTQKYLGVDEADALAVKRKHGV